MLRQHFTLLPSLKHRVSRQSSAMRVCEEVLPDMDGFETILCKFLLKFGTRSSKIADTHPNLPYGASTSERRPGSTGKRL